MQWSTESGRCPQPKIQHHRLWNRRVHQPLYHIRNTAANNRGRHEAPNMGHDPCGSEGTGPREDRQRPPFFAPTESVLRIVGERRAQRPPRLPRSAPRLCPCLSVLQANQFSDCLRHT